MKLSVIKEVVARDEEGVVVPINDPSGEPYTAGDGSEVTITVTGLQSKARQKAEDAAAQAISRQGKAAFEPVAIRARRLTLAASCVTAWHGWEEEDGSPIPFSRDNVKLVLSADERILEQVEAAIRQHSDFLPRS